MAVNPLSLLFGQAAATEVPEEFIEVFGARDTGAAPPQPGLYDDFVLNNSDAIKERQYAAEMGDDAAQHKGMFGTKGTLRDILGTVGDAFLIQSGNDPIYANQRQRERAADAMTGFSRDPVAAAERMAGVNPEFAGKMLDNYGEQQFREAQQRSVDANRQSQIQNRQQDMVLELGERAAQLLRRARSPEDRMYAFQVIDTFAKRNGLTLDDLGLSMAMTPEEAAVYSGMGITVNQQEQLPLAERRLDQADRRIDQGDERNRIYRQSVNRPRAPSNPTEATEMTRIREKVNRGERLSPGDAATWKRYTEGTGDGDRRRPVAPPPPPARSRFGRPRGN